MSEAPPPLEHYLRMSQEERRELRLRHWPPLREGMMKDGEVELGGRHTMAGLEELVCWFCARPDALVGSDEWRRWRYRRPEHYHETIDGAYAALARREWVAKKRAAD